MKKKLTMVNNIICVVLMVVTFATLLIPCWDFVAEEKIKVKTCRECGLAVNLENGEEDLPEGYVCPGQNGVACGATGKRYFKNSTTKVSYDDTASVMEFTWLAFKNKGLTAHFEEQGYTINSIVLAPFLLTLFSIAGCVFCILNHNGSWHSVFPLAGAGLMTYNMLTIPVFHSGPWMVGMIACAATTLASFILFVQFVVKVVKWFTVPCYKK